ncbi:MAG: hypothetical protein U0U70_10915 [Chitinophagaceae bacterium]
MSWIDSAINFFKEKDFKLSHKLTATIVVLFGLFIIDSVFNFSFHYRTIKKIDELEKLNVIINSAADSVTKAYALKLRDEIINKKSLRDYLGDLFEGKSKKAKYINAPPNANNNESPNQVLFIISSVALYVLFFMSIGIRQAFFDRQPTIWDRIGTIISITLFTLAVCFFFVSLFRLIPKLSANTWGYNYGLNFILHAGLLALILWQAERQSNKEG